MAGRLKRPRDGGERSPDRSLSDLASRLSEWRGEPDHQRLHFYNRLSISADSGTVVALNRRLRLTSGSFRVRVLATHDRSLRGGRVSGKTFLDARQSHRYDSENWHAKTISIMKRGWQSAEAIDGRSDGRGYVTWSRVSPTGAISFTSSDFTGTRHIGG